MRQEYPSIEIYALFLPSVNRYDLGTTPAESLNNLALSNYGLWPDVKLVEGNEEAYDYPHAEQSGAARRS